MNIAIVTGASSGMGREFVLQLSGYVQVDEIWVIARRADALENLKGEVSVPVRPISMDLLDMESFDRFQSLLEEEKPRRTGFGVRDSGFAIPDPFALYELAALLPENRLPQGLGPIAVRDHPVLGRRKSRPQARLCDARDGREDGRLRLEL